MTAKSSGEGGGAFVFVCPERKSDYGNRGYEVLRDAFRPDALEAIATTLRRSLMKNSGAGGELSLDDMILAREVEDHSLVYKASQSLGSSSAAYRLLGSSGILDIVCGLTGFDPAELHLMPMYLIVQLPGNERFDYAWHQDRAYYDWCEELVALWFPVNRAVNADTGTISLIPGTHRDGPRPNNAYFRHGFFRQIEATTREHEVQHEQVLELQLGDCCVMDGNLLHRSVANRSLTPRVAGVVRVAHLGASAPYERDRFYCVHKS